MRQLSIAMVVMMVLASGCATVPMTSLEEDTTAKQFTVKPGSSNIYLYRNETLGGAITMPVSLDSRIAGKTGPTTYFLWEVQPGEHEIASYAENTTKIKIDAVGGQNHYIWQEVKMGMWQARSQLHEVSEEVGQKGVLECKRANSEL